MPMSITAPTPPPSPDHLQRVYIPHLRTQFQRARPILFTGAGFSVSAKNASAETLPTYREIRQHLWTLCFPGEAFEDDSTLPDLFEHAVQRHRNALSRLLVRLLTVDADSLPQWYKHLISFPWLRCYTLNIDDLMSAASRAFALPRRVRPVSATSPHQPATDNNHPDLLEVIHLNGTLDDLPDHVTFSVTQFADRLSKPDPWYMRFVVDLLSHPIVIIGTRLDEPPLWQHLEYRGARGNRQLGELRPRSYLVTPHLARPRRALLAELNICWLPMTAEQFTADVLGPLEDARIRGLQFLRTHSAGRTSSREVPEVADLAINPTMDTKFLHGHEPIWADLQSGRAIRRDSDDKLWAGITYALQKDSSTLIVVTGTAGSGKSTTLMGTCLKLTAQGERVGWVDRDASLSPHDVLRCIKADGSPRVLAIDDADIYGSSLAAIVKDMFAAHSGILVMLGVFVYRVEARKSAKWCAGLVRMCRYVQYGSRGRQTGRFEGARARG